MAVTAPTDITALPTPPSSSSPSNFDTRADNFLAALPTFVTEANALGDNVYANAQAAETAATNAETAETNAETAATAADAARVLATGAANYVGVYAGGTTYTVGQCVSYDPGGGEQRYVAKQTTAGNLPTNTTYWLMLPSSGTVTSVAVSGGTTGLTTSGGPITSTGTITLAGTVAVANGGTGQTTYTNGQLLIGNTSGNTLAKGTLTAGAGVAVTNGAGSITVAVDKATDANFKAATSNKVVTCDILNTANAPETANSTSSYTPNLDLFRVLTLTLTATCAIANPDNARAGQSGLLFITQTGTSAFTVSWGSYYKWPGGTPSLSTAQNKVNCISYYVKSTTEIVCSFLGSY